MAIEEKKSNIVATEQIAANLEQVTGEVTKLDANAEPSAEQTILKPLHPEVEAADVVIHTDQGITKLNDAAEGLGGRVSGSEVHAGNVDGSGIALPVKEQKIVTELFASRAHIPGPVENTSTWRHVTQTKNKIVGLFRRLPKAA